MPRRLTNRQTAVLAAVERLGRANLRDLHGEFPALAPSTVARVLDALLDRGLVQCSGDPSMIYLGGVEYWVTSRKASPTPAAAETVAARFARIDGINSWADGERRTVHVLLPVAGILARLCGPSDPFDQVADAVRELEQSGEIGPIGTETMLALSGPTPALELVVTMPD